MGIINSLLETLKYYLFQSDVILSNLLIALFVTLLMSLYVYFIYQKTSISTFVDPDFGMSMTMISLVVTTIIMVSKSNFAISLSAIGALSIVRFRTAVKNPSDLMYMFWAIGNGIICGTGVYNVAVISALFITLGILTMRILPKRNISTYLLSINLSNKDSDEKIYEILKNNTKKYLLDTKNITNSGKVNMVFEIRSDNVDKLLNEIHEQKDVENVSVLHHTGDYNK